MSDHEADSDIDCNGVCFGEALVDDCGVCSEGNTGLDFNADKDCNGDCFGVAFIDNCGYCVEGNTGLEENYADLGCDCDNPAPSTYCLDQDGDTLGDPNISNLYCLEDSEGNSYPVPPDDIWILDCTDLDDTCGAINEDGNGEYDFGEDFIDDNGNGIWDEDEIFVDGFEYNYYDCNNDCGGVAFEDDCGYCVEGNTGLDEDYADVGCDCDNPPPLEYCEDTDGDELGDPGSESL